MKKSLSAHMCKYAVMSCAKGNELSVLASCLYVYIWWEIVVVMWLVLGERMLVAIHLQSEVVTVLALCHCEFIDHWHPHTYLSTCHCQVCICVCVCLYLSVCLCVFLCTYDICMHVYVCLYLSVCLSVLLCTYDICMHVYATCPFV